MSRETDKWAVVCTADELEPESVIRFDHEGRTFAVYRSPEGDFYATDGFCTHEKAHLADGFVDGHVIECPKHYGRFDYTSGQAEGAPVFIDLKTYPVKVEAGKVFVNVG